jgi:signal recognition particle subunit SEC65
MEKTEDLKKKWIKFYPSYIDKGLKYGEGRKVSSAIAVENPTAREIFIICGEYMKLDCVEEYVRD